MGNWERYPALFYGVAALAGIGTLYGYWPLLLLAFLAKAWIKRIGFCLVAFAMLLHTNGELPSTYPTKRESGVGYFKVRRIKEIEGKQDLSYQGSLVIFRTNKEVFEKVLCLITVKEGERPLGNCDYLVKGKISPLNEPWVKMNITSWERVPYTFSFAELRFHLKKNLKNFLRKHVEEENVFAFFSSLATGEVHNKILSNEFAKVGLNHTLAISGFHYTFLILMIGTFLQVFFSKRRVALLLLVLVTLYFLFIGETPSLNRAWLAAEIFLLGYLLKRDSNGLNALGLALLVSLVIDPSVLFNLGFQLSYLATFAILALFPPVDLLFRVLMPVRPFSEVAQMNLFHQHGYLLSNFTRQTLALTLSVNLVTLPLVLYHFAFFPFASFFYNLFFPFAMSFTMILLLIATLLPPLAPFFLKIAEWYSGFLVDMIYYSPPCLAGGITLHHFPTAPLILLLTTFFLLGLFFSVDGNKAFSLKWLQKSFFCGGSSSVG